MKYDAIVQGGYVALPECEEPIRADIAITNGRVAALVAPETSGVEADRCWSAEGRIVYPGAIDPHVHVSWPFLSSRTADDYLTATRAAARGGTTTIIDFAIEGRDSPAAAVRRRRAEAEEGTVIDFSLHCVVSAASERVLDELEEVVGEGVPSFKLYMTYRRRGLMVDDATLFAIAERAAELGASVGVHAENGALEESQLNRMQEDGRLASSFFRELKPPFVEAEAVARAARIVAAAGAQLWILHLSSAEALDAAMALREQVGQPAAIETCPQYLLLDERALNGELGHRFLCSPPLRTRRANAMLWKAVQDGTIDWIGTDHCLFLASQKDNASHSFAECPHGLPGIETRPALILRAAIERGISPGRCARLLAANAASWFGLYPRKGTLLPGSDADLALWDPAAFTVIRNDDLSMGGDWNPYEGHSALARPSLVLRRGEPIVEAGEVHAEPASGVFLARQPTSSPDREIAGV